MDDWVVNDLRGRSDGDVGVRLLRDDDWRSCFGYSRWDVDDLSVLPTAALLCILVCLLMTERPLPLSCQRGDVAFLHEIIRLVNTLLPALMQALCQLRIGTNLSQSLANHALIILPIIDQTADIGSRFRLLIGHLALLV